MRLLSARNPDELMYYVGQSLLILLPPSLYAATIYMIYGRIVLFVNAPEASIIPPTRVTKIFVVSDVPSFFVQSGGGDMMAQAGKEDLCEKILLVGLGLQLLFFGFFPIIVIVFDRRMSSSLMRYTIPLYGKHNWRNLLLLLLAAAVLIIARCVYRVAEFSAGCNGYLMTHEYFMVIGDTAPMFLVQTMVHLVHAGDVFPHHEAVLKSENGSYINLHDQV